MVQTDEERKAKAKARRSTPEYKANQKAYQKEYQSTPENKARKKLLRNTPERKAKKKAQEKVYNETPERKAKQKERNSRPEIKAKRREHESTPEYKATRSKTRANKRLKVLQYYSKQLSKSDIPCCNCCGENSYTEFLALDHIAGRKQMDSESELVKIGYSSSMKDRRLINWITENGFPPYFQILCHSCNFAKGHSKNNKCPHQK